MKNVMVDIETLATTTDALVLSIGAQVFTMTEEAPVFGEHVLVVPSLVEQILAGRRIDRDTQLWWAKQSRDAAEHWVLAAMSPQPVSQALYKLAEFIKGADRVWARGPHFDIAILDSLHQTFGFKSPWGYNAIRDVRTFCDDRDKVRTMTLETDSGIGMNIPAHHPLQDCKVQIIDLWEHGL